MLSHKLRLALTALAVVLGVTFISGTFVLTDTLNMNNTFSVLFSSVYQHVDFAVCGDPQLGSTGANAIRNELPASLQATVSRVPGVAAAEGEVEGYAQFVARYGKPIATGGAPALGVNFDTDRQLSSLRIIAGGPPVTSDDVVMDAGTASKYDFRVGQRVRPRPRRDRSAPRPAPGGSHAPREPQTAPVDDRPQQPSHASAHPEAGSGQCSPGQSRVRPAGFPLPPLMTAGRGHHRRDNAVYPTARPGPRT
jgi:MacB-like periplasmic core domain